MRILFFLILSVTIFFFSCTPVSQKKKRPIKERIISEMTVIEKDVEDEQKKPDLKEYNKKKYTVRVGILDGVTKVLFAYDGLYSIYSKGIRIFGKRRSEGSWKISTEGDMLIFENLDSGEAITVEDELVFRPEQISSYVTIGNVTSGRGWHWQNTRSRSYKGDIEFLNSDGRVIIVNEVALEQYLYGVVPSEMPSSAPIEALKAQAVLARTNVFSSLGLKYKNKPYNLSSDIYSQVYTGIDNMNERTSRAVDDTRGMILTYKGLPVEALFHSVCGGHTEGNDIIWGSKRLPYLKPKPCSCEREVFLADLKNERNFKRWINSNPDCYCNLENKPVSANLNFAKKYFRWKVSYDRSELEKRIKSATGTDIGRLKDIVIPERGVSGKAVRIKLSGTKRSVYIARELNIRKLTSPPLYSANFYVEKSEIDYRGYADKFIFKGAGFGHGAGMCQIGAVGMAGTGKSFREIIDHYFTGTKVTRLE